MATKRLRTWFFTITSVLRADGTTGGVRLRKTDKPTQQTMEDLLASTALFSESSDRARVSTGATLSSEQGLAVLASNTQATTNATQLADRSLVVQPHQLPTVTPLANATTEDMPVTVMETTAEVAVTTRNNYQVRPTATWLTWLISRLFKADGVEGDVPIKTDGTDYNWSWANVGNNTTTVNAIAGNATFISTLTNNAAFATALETTITNIITTTPNYFSENLEVGFMRVHPVAAMPSAKWLRCDGTAISRTTYATLYNLLTINNTVPAPYGIGDGSTTFNLPNFTDKQITGYSGTKALGSTGGSETQTLDATKLPVAPLYAVTDGGHTHGITLVAEAPPVNAVFSNGTGTAGTGGGETILDPLTTKDINTVVSNIIPATTDSDTTGITLGNNVGGGQSINTLDPYLAVNIIIKVTA